MVSTSFIRWDKSKYVETEHHLRIFTEEDKYLRDLAYDLGWSCEESRLSNFVLFHIGR